ncbi:glycosyltransferase family 2 protein [Paenibacillus albidus]|uniref:tetratricopeptide repeat-containing glycosyltransferase family 2 protein n=1 Tax=Paenibacillus albidus TaxID=2041023 RepID=UPI001BE7AE40|nr:glycosyltransferase family 2 protein [Paenibacillus albidus]MBT2291602.1 glycosyltransferase family 2 protein [Paenibacillus albidus]
MKLSLVMIVKNEESTLRRCLESVAKYVDEIIIVDTGSTDNTKSIALEYQSRVFDYEWTNDFAAARNYALDKSTCEWSLVLDADEFLSKDCSKALRNHIHSTPAVGKAKLVDKFMGKDGISYEQIYISRLFPSDCRYTGKIHEQIVSDLPRHKVDIEIQHDGYFKKEKSSRNLPILLNEISDHPEDPYFHYQIAKEYRGTGNHEEAYSHLRIAYSKITGKEGYAPSVIINFMYSIISSGHLADGLTVLENEQDFLKNSSDFYFVSALYLLELIYSDPDQYGELLPLIEDYYLRALEIGDNEQEGSVIGTGSFAAHHNLGVFYEVTGNIAKAQEQYRKAANYNYEPSLERLREL